MPDLGKAFTWLIENGGTMMTWIIVSAIVLFTLWVKKDEWFGKRTSAPKTPAPIAVEPEPKKVPEPEPAKTVKVEPAPVPKKEDKTLENFRLGLWRMFGAGIAMIIIVLLAKNLNKMKNDYIFDGPVARPQVAGASQYFAWKYIYENEVKMFWYFDPDLNLKPRVAWNMVDTIKHESRGFRMYNQDGSVLRGDKNPRDVGVHQINLDHSKDEMAEAGCTEAQMESFDCQVKVARIKYKKRGHQPWKSYDIVMKKPITTTVIVAPVGEWSEIYYVEQGSSCLWSVDREIDMLLASGEVKKLIPDKATFFDSPTTVYSVPDGAPGTVTIECRR